MRINLFFGKLYSTMLEKGKYDGVNIGAVVGALVVEPTVVVVGTIEVVVPSVVFGTIKVVVTIEVSFDVIDLGINTTGKTLPSTTITTNPNNEQQNPNPKRLLRFSSIFFLFFG